MFRLLLLATSIAACGTPPPIATGVDAERSHVALAELQQGRSLLVEKCGGCHHTPLPSEHLRFDWPMKLREMAARANLDHAQRRAIETYLVAMAPR